MMRRDDETMMRCNDRIEMRREYVESEIRSKLE